MKLNDWGPGLIAACLLLGAFAATAVAQDKYATLSRYSGKYPDSRFFALPEVAQPLHRLLGGNVTDFRSLFQVKFPLGMVGTDLVAEGCVRHECAERRAAFAIDLQTGHISAATLNDHRFTIYSDRGKQYLDLNPGLRMWISRVTDETTPGKMSFSFVK